MLLDFDVIVPAGTLQSLPAVTHARLVKSTLVKVKVIFPPGPVTLVHVVIKDRQFQIMPLNPEADLNLEDSYAEATMEYPINDDPFTLDIYGWSPDAVFDHTITVQFDVIPPSQNSWQDFTQQLQALLSQQPSM